MNAIPNEPCAHPGCGCKVDAGQRYCSDYCQQKGERPVAGETCDCGHSDCIIEEAVRRVDRD